MAKEQELAQTESDIRIVCNDVAATLIEKNRSYGDSALNPIRIFCKADAIEGLHIRIDDKLSRLKSGNGAAFKEDVLLDLLGYLVLLRVAHRRQGGPISLASKIGGTDPDLDSSCGE